MMDALRFSWLIIALGALVTLAWGSEATQIPSYLLKVRVEPSLSRIECEVTIQHPPEPYFYLNPNMEIHRVVADGQAVPFHRDSTEHL